jgi:hypothetical protein
VLEILEIAGIVVVDGATRIGNGCDGCDEEENEDKDDTSATSERVVVGRSELDEEVEEAEEVLGLMLVVAEAAVPFVVLETLSAEVVLLLVVLLLLELAVVVVVDGDDMSELIIGILTLSAIQASVGRHD